MKKICLSIVFLFIISGTAWSQLVFPNPDGLDANFHLNPNAGFEWEGGTFFMFDSFYAPPIISTQARYSAGIFSSDIDTYLDVNYHNMFIGTFVLAGAFPQADMVNRSDTSFMDTGLSFGFARTINCSYLALYYGGNLVNSIGVRNDEVDGYQSVWRNRFAIMLSTPNLGAFRIDGRLDMTRDQERTNGGLDLKRIHNNAPSFAVTWGGVPFRGFLPYITVGYQFPSIRTHGGERGGNYAEATHTSSSYLGIQTGVHYDFDEERSIRTDISFVYGTPERFRGHPEIIGTPTGPGVTGPIDPFDRGGGWGVGLRAAYRQEMTFGQFTFGFSPSISAAFRRTTYAEGSHTDTLNDYYAQVLTGIDLGLKYELNHIFSFYTGLSLRILNWGFNYASGINTGLTESYHRLDGIAVSRSSLAGYNNYLNLPVENYLGFGMVVQPVPNLHIGVGLNTFLDKFFIIRPGTLRIEAGEFFEHRGEYNVGSWLMGIFRGLQLDLTISYRF